MTDAVANALLVYRALHPRSRVQSPIGVRYPNYVCRFCNRVLSGDDTFEGDDVGPIEALPRHADLCAGKFINKHTDNGLLTIAEAIEMLQAERG